MASSSSSSSNTILIAVALYRRDPISTDPRRRQIYQHEAYHWGILIITRGTYDYAYDAYDATDRNEINPNTLRQENPRGDWWFRSGTDVDRTRSGMLLGYIIIGTLPSQVTRANVGNFLEGVTLPKRNVDPQESCVTWVANAIRKFREYQYINDFNVGKFLDWALVFADQRLWSLDETEEAIYYDKETEKPEKKK
ncbi:hypothetical protein QQS21_009486 [Conoideocrella luteorostrata]|uniref:Uncharacterized protein n=1 Tax=Conoideocrella luteorostrata TaxID=1105319 RepID=A0AAJ0CJ67_9HYPO|nr:hypothetical protein QQS21_009486 [Conoideocrella luteorostrata]